MTHKQFGESLKPAKFTRKHQYVKYNPIRPLNYSKDHVHTILRDSAVKSNALNPKALKNKKRIEGIKGMFCYDAAKYDDER